MGRLAPAFFVGPERKKGAPMKKAVLDSWLTGKS
jgi:hypothetical protein